MYLYIESLDVCKSMLNRDHMKIDSNNKCRYEKYIIVNK